MNLIIGRENTFDTETLIYEKGDNVESIAFIKSGSIRIEADYGKKLIEAGNFVALNDLRNGFYLNDYYALPGCKLMAFSADSLYSFAEFMEANPEIHKSYRVGICSMIEFFYN